MEELSGGDLLPGRIYLCGGGSRLPEIRDALAAEAFWKRMPFARPPEVTVLSPDADRDRRRCDATSSSTSRTSRRSAWRTRRSSSRPTADPLDVALRRVLARDEGLRVGTSRAILYLDIDDEITTAAARSARRRRRASRSCCRTARASRRRGSTSGCSGARRDAQRQAAVDRRWRRGDARARRLGRTADLRNGGRVRDVDRLGGGGGIEAAATRSIAPSASAARRRGRAR